MSMILDLPEANLQGEFYYWSKVIGLRCVLEYSTPFGRLDVAILSYDLERLVAVVECKRSEVRAITPQIARYKQLGVPVFVLSKMERAEGLARKIHREYSRSESGTPLYKIPTMTGVRRYSRRRSERFNSMNLCEEINFKE